MISCFLISFIHQVEFFLMIFFNILADHYFTQLYINVVVKPDLVSEINVYIY